jgi:hypothetical protein
VLLAEQPGSRNDAALRSIRMDELRDVAQQIFYRHPDIRIQPGIEPSVLSFELGLPATILAHPHLDDVTRGRCLAELAVVFLAGTADEALSSIPCLGSSKKDRPTWFRKDVVGKRVGAVH